LPVSCLFAKRIINKFTASLEELKSDLEEAGLEDVKLVDPDALARSQGLQSEPRPESV
jgi:hypothetical protein